MVIPLLTNEDVIALYSDLLKAWSLLKDRKRSQHNWLWLTSESPTGLFARWKWLGWGVGRSTCVEKRFLGERHTSHFIWPSVLIFVSSDQTRKQLLLVWLWELLHRISYTSSSLGKCRRREILQCGKMKQTYLVAGLWCHSSGRKRYQLILPREHNPLGMSLIPSIHFSEASAKELSQQSTPIIISWKGVAFI